MDNQDHGSNHSSGHESHGVHLCHKCGWPFPNPHPSARHRRAHKKICGTIEGYKLVGSGDSTHTTASDDEPLSDEDPKTPITQVPKVMGSDSLEKSIGGIGAMSSRSEAEVFSDAAMEFHDSGFVLGKQGSLDNASKADQIAEKDLTATISSKDCEDTDIILPPQNSSDKSQKKYPLLESTPILSMGTPEHQDVGLSCSKDSENRNGSASDVVPIEKETVIGVSEESREVSAVERVAECSVGQATYANDNEEGKLNKNLSGGLVLPSEHAGEISKTVSISEKRLDVTSDMVQFKEESSDRLASETSMSESGKQETDGRGKPGINLERNLMDIVASNSEDACVTSEKTEFITSEIVLAEKIVELENSDKLAHNMVIDDLSPKTESANDMDTFQIQTDAAQGTYSSAAVDSKDVFDKKEKENESVYVLSVPDDIPVVDKAEINLEGFKDHSRVKLPQLEALATEEIIIDKEHELRDRVSLDKSDSFLSNQLDEDIKVETSYAHVAEDSYKLGGNNVAMVKEVLVEGKADALQINPVNKSEGPHLERVSNGQDNLKESKISRDNGVQEECVNKDHIASVAENSGADEFERTSVDQLGKEDIHSPPYSEPTSQSVVAFDNNHTRESGMPACGPSTVILHGEADNGSVKPQLDTTVGDLSIESSSQTDSLEGHWGSVSVLSTQSDIPAVNGTETLPTTVSHAFSEAEKANIKKSKVASEEQDFDESEEFDPPSFMTLVEPGGGEQKDAVPGGGEQKDAVSQIQTAQNAQNPGASPLQAGWFPSLSHVANESPGRKKNEEIIEKVTNWNAKQRTPLKNLLVEASSETKLKSPNSKENPAVVDAREEKVAKDNGALGAKGSSIRGPKTPVAEPTNMKSAGKEWNAPARYPVDIKREKRKGRPLWFLCCSSVN